MMVKARTKDIESAEEAKTEDAKTENDHTEQADRNEIKPTLQVRKHGRWSGRDRRT